jgi:hypothetical protein
LADRAILLTLDPISEEQRRSEGELWREFVLARPAILGALLDARPARQSQRYFRSFSTMAIMRSRSQADMLVGSENLNVESLGRGS